MIEISRYMDDGAGWQEQAVLAYVRKFADSVKDIEKPYRASDEEKAEMERLHGVSARDLILPYLNTGIVIPCV